VLKNTTFVENFSGMLQQNLKYLRETNHIPQKEIAELLEVNRSTYRNYETGRSDLTTNKLLKLAEFYQVRVDDLLTKDIGSPSFSKDNVLEDNITSKHVRVLPIAVPNNDIQDATNVEFVSVKAMAGYSINNQEEAFISSLPRIQIPKLPKGIYRAFEIEGDSMPPIEQGYIVIGKYINHIKEIKNGKRYVLVLRNNGIVFKRVTSEFEQNKKLILVSDNSEYTPFSVDGTNVLEAWEFVAFIGFPTNIDMNYIILDKLHELERKMNLLFLNS